MARRLLSAAAPGRLLRFTTALVIAALPLTLAGQAPAPRPAATGTWADDIIKQEGYAVPPRELADAVLAPRHLNVSLSALSPDKKWFVDETGDGPMEYFVRLGYAVVEPDSPIVGRDGQMNDNYVHDLRTNLSVVIDELDRRALVDRTRLAIGGHSYGAFSAVNAMVHTPFFKAGIAGDGAYNRTLTPIGFQSERRDLWEAPQVYLNMSPFLYANHLTGALLMYHGLADQNVGTDPQNSIRLYHALNGLGKTTALYLYPLEDHGPASKETLLDLWARWSGWLDKHVKNPKVEIKKATTTNEQAQR